MTQDRRTEDRIAEDPVQESIGLQSRLIEGMPPNYVVGIGASAGGLEALEQFFHHVPRNTQMAFVVVQHLSPNFKSMMDELLARQTSLPIQLVDQEMKVESGKIYLMPPRKQMIISNGRLLVADKDPAEDFVLPIDHFFRSLGQDLKGKAIGIILSGTGSDGSRGIEHIHRGGGLVVAQSEETTAFDGMTRSAQNTGLVDLVLTPIAMPASLQKYASGPAQWRAELEQKEVAKSTTDGMSTILRLLRRQYGIDFSYYKEDMIERRIERRLLMGSAESVDQYSRILADDEEELSALYRDMLIGVTGFFRDPEAYQQLEKNLLPKLMEKLKPGDEFRVWVAATATGEEAYSIAILVDEYFAARGESIRCRIFATDVHQASLDVASQGLYPEGRVRDLSTARLERYFRKEAHGYRVVPEIRSMVVFAPHNVITDAPFTNLNLVTCRNLFIYFKPEIQRRVLTLFHFGLNVGGGLWMGSSEFPSELVDEFEAIDSHWKLYTKVRDVRLSSRGKIPQSSPSGATQRGIARRADRPTAAHIRTYDTLLSVFMPPAILITPERQLLQTFGGASRYFQLGDGRASDDVLDQLDPALRVPIGTALRRASQSQQLVDFSGVTYATSDGSRQLKLSVRPIPNPSDPGYLYLIEFKLDEENRVEASTHLEVDVQMASSMHVESLEKELSYAKQSLNATIEELQAANEEMQSANEELVASNEELQSTNEELHSVNEELYTVNAEYQRKISELTELTDDMDNLLNSTNVDTIFLDRKLKVRKFTPDVAEKFNLLRQDIGRDFESFTYRLDDDDLIDELRQVLHTEKSFEREVSDRKSNHYLMRILPYVSRGCVEGVVLTLVNITNLKQAQSRLAELSEIVEQSGDAIFSVDRNGLIRTWNAGAKKIYGYSDDIVGRPLADLFADEIHDELDGIFGEMALHKTSHQLETQQARGDKSLFHVAISLSPVLDERGRMTAASVIARDISDRIRAEAEIQESIDRRDQFLAMLSHELRNPLGAIVNAARLIQSTYEAERRQLPDSEPPAAAGQGVECSSILQKSSEVVIRQSKQMSRLLDDLLDVSRITLGKIELKREVIDLRETVEDAVRAIGPAFSENNISFQFDNCDQPVVVEGDAARLQQVVVNLLRNASKYTKNGGHVRLLMVRDDDWVKLRIRDDGVGIASDMQSKIFDMFVQVNSTIARSQGGIGLGLTLVKAVVSMHGGDIEVFSEGLGLGSEFRVRLPLTQRPIAAMRSASIPSKIHRIVIVEDIADAREMLQGLLRLKGYEVHSAGDGLAGLKLIQELKPDVSLIDVGLPEIDGYEVARRLRHDRECNALFLIALTGYGQASDREAVKLAGFDEHLVKPLDLDQLNTLLCRGERVEA